VIPKEFMNEISFSVSRTIVTTWGSLNIVSLIYPNSISYASLSAFEYISSSVACVTVIGELAGFTLV
jgi:hypothetical protein